MKKIFLILILSKAIVFASPTITDVIAKQRYPWNGKVDIAFTMTEDVAAGLPEWNKPVLSVSAVDRATGLKYEAQASALSGDTEASKGVHHIVWDMGAQGLKFRSDEVVFTVGYTAHSLYCIIDLSAGANAKSYTVTYMSDVPSGGWNAEHKTAKLVLRLIEPGSFKMHGVEDATLTKPYYIGVFEVTQRQYQLVTGKSPFRFSGDRLPAECVSWNMIRGDSDTYNWPTVKTVDSNSFVGRIRARTGLKLDLPTEAQWEYACRAGTTTAYSYGNSRDSRYQWDASNSGSTTHEVGTKLPNAWGLYDMHGNVWEWCLTRYTTGGYGGIDPEGPSTGGSRSSRGGGIFSNVAYACSSNDYASDYPSDKENDLGFRIVGTLSE